MTDIRIITVIVMLTGLVVASTVRPVLTRLPEPAEPDGKITYRDLATPRFVIWCAVLAASAEAVSWTVLPLRVQPLWWVLASCGVVLAMIDACTTWLPLRLTYPGWALMAGAAGASLLVGADGGSLVRTLIGGGIAGLLYLSVWAVTRGGFGFGDVRFAPLLGAATAGHSWTLLLWGLTCGTAVGALHGISRLVRKKPGSFPYAPSMLMGTYLAATALHILER